MQIKFCRQAKLVTLTGEDVFFNGYRYSLTKDKESYKPARSVEYSTETIWEAAKQRRLAKAEEQLNAHLYWIEIEPKEVGFYSV